MRFKRRPFASGRFSGKESNRMPLCIPAAVATAPFLLYLGKAAWRWNFPAMQDIDQSYAMTYVTKRKLIILLVFYSLCRLQHKLERKHKECV